ncbi:MAG: hypothetical protein BWZ04_02349 [Firmicutes bacterium ADurb.BinA205]|nr:MAG: hypothetical protein BWZ04_02349 [Firmicutes bacterium ADurb.BinA205]
MKRLSAFAVFFVMAFCLVSCAVPVKSSSTSHTNGLDSTFESAVTFTLEKMTAEGTLIRSGSGLWSVEFESPNTLSGVKLDFSDGEVSASYKGLEFSVPQSALPVKAMMLNLIKAVDDNARLEKLSGEEKDGSFIVPGTLEGGDYQLGLDSDGRLVSFEMPNYKLSITLHDTSFSTAPEEQT